MAILLGGPVSLGGWIFRAFLRGLSRNLVGGVLLVALLGIVQARTLRRPETSSGARPRSVRKRAAPEPPRILRN
jgi:hypothetical protein